MIRDNLIMPEWMKSQGFNLSECGATCAASAAHWATGIKYNRFEARESNIRGSNWLGWWNLFDISKFLTDKNISTKLKGRIEKPSINVLTIFRVRGNHFVMVINNGASLHVYSPLFRGSAQSTEWGSFKKRINWHQSLSVYK